MAQVALDVELIVQEQNPICWIASCAMVKGYGTKTSVGVGDFTGGFDPSNSCIANLAGSWSQCTDMMPGWGFNVFSVGDVAGGTMTGDALVGLLQSNGPAVLLHLCNGFPYGPKWTPLTAGAHAVVLTGVDSDAGTGTFNNPWGDKDQSIDLPTLLSKINSDQSMGKSLAFWKSQ
jgi:Papain-like cysteine protease AvrRpt2